MQQLEEHSNKKYKKLSGIPKGFKKFYSYPFHSYLPIRHHSHTWYLVINHFRDSRQMQFCLGHVALSDRLPLLQYDNQI